jgi:hypothetical protein
VQSPSGGTRRKIDTLLLVFLMKDDEKCMKDKEYQGDRVEEAVFNSVSEMGAEPCGFYC